MDYLSSQDEDDLTLLTEDSHERQTLLEDPGEAAPKDEGETQAVTKEYIQIGDEYPSSSDYSDSSGVDSSSMTTSTSSSKSWEILDGPEPDLEGNIDQEALAAATAEEEEDLGLVGSVSRDAKQVLDGLRLEMRELSDGCSHIASSVDKVRTGIAEKINKAFQEGAKSAESAVSTLRMDWLDEKTNNAASSSCEQLDNCNTASQSQDMSHQAQSPMEETKKEKGILRKITSVIYNKSTLVPLNLRALHTEGLFSPTNEVQSSQVAKEISYCGPGEQMIIETQQNDPSDPIAVLVVYEIVNLKSQESVGFLRLQAVWHCFEGAPRVRVSMGSEPTPSAEEDSLNSLDVTDNLRLRCVTKELDMSEGDYYVQSITVNTEEIGSIAMVGKSFERLIQKFKAL